MSRRYDREEAEAILRVQLALIAKVATRALKVIDGKAELVYIPADPPGEPDRKGRKLAKMNREEMDFLDDRYLKDIVGMSVAARVALAEVRVFTKNPRRRK